MTSISTKNITERIQYLNQEASALSEQREQLLSLVQQIEIRLHQIAGANTELIKLTEEQESTNETVPVD